MITRPRKYGLKDTQLMGSSEIIRENRILALEGEILGNGLIMKDDLRILAKESKQPIKIEILSQGGLVGVGLALYNTIRSINQSGVPVYTIGYMAYSMAAVILAAGHKGHRYVSSEGIMMLHSTAVGAMGNVNQATLNILRKNDKIVIDLISELCGKTPEQRNELYRILVEEGQEKWFTAKEAIEFGLADEILTPEISYQLFVADLEVPSWEEGKRFNRE